MQASESPARPSVALIDLGRTRYAAALALQRRLHAARKAGETLDTLLLTEHEPVITTGEGADFRHLLVAPEALAARGIDLVQVERGGDITYHGPGQLVVYPILDLHRYGRDVHRYVRLLEESARRLLVEYGVDAVTRPGAPGLYVDGAKIASVGVFVSRWATMHGLAINLTPDPAHLGLLVPCGLAGVRYTSVALLTGEAPSYADAAARYAAIFADVFGCTVRSNSSPLAPWHGGESE